MNVKLSAPERLGLNRLNALLVEFREVLKPTDPVWPVGKSSCTFTEEFWLRLLSVEAPPICENCGETERTVVKPSTTAGSNTARAKLIWSAAV